MVFAEKEKKWLIFSIIIAIAVILRFYYLFTFQVSHMSPDEYNYDVMTRQFLEKGFLGYRSNNPNAFVTPGYPLFLAVIYKMADIIGGPGAETIPFVWLIQTLIGVGAVLLIFAVTRRAAGIIPALVASFLAAIYPPLIYSSCRLLTENLYTFLFLVFIFLIAAAFENNTILYHALAGGVFGLLTLVRPSGVPLILVPYLLKYFKSRDIRVLKNLAIAGIFFFLVMLPWWVRNYIILNEFIAFATQTGNPFLRGMDPFDPYDKIGPSIMRGVPEGEMLEVGIKKFIEGFRENTFLWLKWLTVGKLSYLWLRPWGYVPLYLNNSQVEIMHLFIVVTGGIGIIYGSMKEKLSWLAVIPLVYTLIQMMFIPLARYVFPLTPVMIILSSVVIVKFLKRVSLAS